MARLRKATLFALFALFCGPLVGSAGAASGLFPPTVTDGGFPPFVGTTLEATLNSTAVGDALTWETCGDLQLGATASPTSATYPLQPSDSGKEICAVEVDAANTVDGISDPVGPVGPSPTISAAGATVVQGQSITVTPGAWGAGASTPVDAWYRCDASAQSCVQIQGVAGGAYTAERADVGSTIEAQETATSADGTKTLTVTSPPSGLVSALAPTTTSPQGVSGTAEVGQPLKASPVGWSNQPTAYTYQWDRCSGGTCAAISGATDSTYSPVAADVGDTLLVYVAGEIDPGTSYGSAGSPYPSYPTSTVIQSPVVPVTNPHIRAVGRLTATMRWTFRYAPTYTQITALAVQGPALGSTIATRCTGKGCPFPVRRIKVRGLKRCRGKAKCRAPRQVNLEGEFRGRNLAVGTKVTVMITRPRDIGKYYGFVVRRRRAPAVKISCLAPGSRIPGKHCTGV